MPLRAVGSVNDVGAGERADVRAGDDAVRDQGFAEGRGAELAGLEDVQQEAVGTAAGHIGHLHAPELRQDHALALP